MSAEGRTYFITGASRGIGRAIALKLAQHGANIAITAKSDRDGDTALEGTIHSVAEEVAQAGGQALAIKVDVRDEDMVKAAADQAAEHFGGIDGVINNASAIYFQPTEGLQFKHYDLMFDVNVRGTFSTVKSCLPYLKKSENAHILTMSPPVNMGSDHLGMAAAYSATKFGMSVMTMGFAKEFAGQNICANTLWPVTPIDTAAIRVHFPDMVKHSRSADIVADAAYAILTGIDPAPTGQMFTDEAALKLVGVESFDQYAIDADAGVVKDFYLD